MADNDVVQKIDHNASQTDIIDTLNDNFQILTRRIKNNNITLSFLDLLRLDKVWSWTDGLSGSTDTQRLQNFISQVWNTLANYSGVYIQCTLAQDSPYDYAFDLHGEKVFNGDYLVKLPGSEFVHIDGQNANYYVPSSTYSYGAGSITYELTSNGPSTKVISMPTAAQSGYQVITGRVSSQGTAPIPSQPQSVRWFTTTGEEVIWTGSYQTDHNVTNMTLDFIACY